MMTGMIKLLLCIAMFIALADGTTPIIISKQEDTSCSNLAPKMIDCTGYLVAGSNQNKPDSTCCSTLKLVLSLNATCVCAAVEGAGAYGITLNMTRVPDLPKLCGVNKLPPAAQCNISMAPTPSPSVPAPSPSVPSPSHGAPQPSTPVTPPSNPPKTAPPPSSPSPSMPTPAPPTTPPPTAMTPTPATPSSPAPTTPSIPTPATPSSPAPATPSTPTPVTPSSPAPTTPSTPAPVTPTAEAPAPSPKSSSDRISLTPLTVVSAVIAVAAFLVT